MRSILLVAAALAVWTPTPACAQETTLRDLACDTAALRADVGESYRRLMALSNRVFGDGDGARITITEESAVDPFYRPRPSR